MSRSKDRSRKAAKDARGGGPFLPVRMDVLGSPALAKLSPYACKLLWDLMSQWRLGRNGDSSAAFEKVLRPRGWRSKSTLSKALKELERSGLIVRTRQGGLHKCSLFALGWLAIDECDGKLETRPTSGPPDFWRTPLLPSNNAMPSTPDGAQWLKSLCLVTSDVPSG
jgi:hypothetical protein